MDILMENDMPVSTQACKYHDGQYLNLMHEVLTTGHTKQDRTNTGTISIFDGTMKFDLSDNRIPLLTTKRIHWVSIIHELLWYIKGDTNIKYLNDHGVRIWNEWATPTGDLGPVYGAQLRHWNNTIDQLQTLINTLKTNPDSRRMVVSYWNPEVLPDEHMAAQDAVANGKQALPPCHMLFQAYTAVVDGNRTLSLKLTQRSADLFLGVPFNIAQYSILMLMLCHITGYKPGYFIWSGGDIHIYTNHLEQCAIQMKRTPYPSPTLTFARQVTSIDDFTFDDFILSDYTYHPAIPAKVAV